MFKVDYHTHSTFSDGRGDYKEIIDRAKEMNLNCVAITDHFDPYDPEERVNSIIESDLFIHFEKIKAYAEKKDQRVLCGIETCTDFKGNLRLSDKVLHSCDIIIASPHYIEYEKSLVSGNYFDEFYWNCYKEKVLNMTAMSNAHILGHPEGYLPINTLLIPNTTTYEERKDICRRIAEKFFNDEYIEEMIMNLKKSGMAFELHCATNTPREMVIKRLVENEVPISFGSDAHILEKVGQVKWAEEMLIKYKGENLQFIR
jgi:HisJ family histidinol phosphate phosphatase